MLIYIKGEKKSFKCILIKYKLFWGVKMEEKTLKKIGLFLDNWKEKGIFKKIDEFHKAQIEKLKKNETPIPFLEGGKVVIHLIPVESFGPQKHYDLSPYKDHPQTLRPMKYQAYDQIYNFDGMLYFSQGANNKCIDYVQVYINGIVEAVDGYYLLPEKKILPILSLERTIIESTKEYLLFQKELGVKVPIIFYLSLLGARDFSIKPISNDIFNRSRAIEREDLSFPKIIIKKFDIVVEKFLKTNFDRLWNACGYPGSSYYDDKGERKE